MAIIDDPSAYFQAKTYTGNGSGSHAITLDGNSNMQPDWVWIKKRNGAVNHLLHDSVRGVTKLLVSNTTGADDVNTNILLGFDSNGFRVGSNSASNNNGDTFVSWNWKAGTSFTNDASATGIGTIDSTGSASDTSGFSIVSYTGTGSAGTIKHGLNSAPNMIIQKNRDETQPWWVWHSSLTGANSYLRLNGTNAEGTDGAALWNSTLPTSSVFSVGDNTGINGSADKCIAYCFAEKQGYSKFGSYVGNGNADGTFVYTGFSPAFVLVKQSSGTNSWVMYDNKRDLSNVTEQILRPDTNGAEGTEAGAKFDFLSNGFKCRGSGAGIGQTNNSGATYIYMAFAENPFVASNFNAATAR